MSHPQATFPQRQNVRVYIDGFNLYHALKSSSVTSARWLNLHSLACLFIDTSQETIRECYYFSALATHCGADTVQRHRLYIDALKRFGITFIQGNFKKKEVRVNCQTPSCLRKFTKYEEKQTDVNLGIYIVKDALLKNTDKMLVITNDTDIAPAIRMAKAHHPSLHVNIITPPHTRPNAELLYSAKQEKPKKILDVHLSQSLLPSVIILPNGRKITKPPIW